YQREYELYHRLVEQSPRAPRLREGEADALMNLGNAYSGLGQLEKAIATYEQGRQTLAPLGEALKRDVRAKMILRNIHWGKADALYNLGRHAQAVPEWDEMLARIDAEREQRPFRLQLAESLVRSGNRTRAAAEAAAVAKAEGVTGAQLLEAARVLALA